MWINREGPNETYSRESWFTGLVSKAKCFFRSRYKDNLSQLPFSHAFPFSFTCSCSKVADHCTGGGQHGNSCGQQGKYSFCMIFVS